MFRFDRAVGIAMNANGVDGGSDGVCEEGYVFPLFKGETVFGIFAKFQSRNAGAADTEFVEFGEKRLVGTQRMMGCSGDARSVFPRDNTIRAVVGFRAVPLAVGPQLKAPHVTGTR